MPITAEFKSGKIPQGEYLGTIHKVEKRDYVDKDGEAFSYLDVHVSIKVGEAMQNMKSGAPLNLSPASKLGRLVQKFHPNTQVGETIDLEAVLVGKNVKAYVQDVQREGITYSEINFETITPQ